MSIFRAGLLGSFGSLCWLTPRDYQMEKRLQATCVISAGCMRDNVGPKAEMPDLNATDDTYASLVAMDGDDGSARCNLAGRRKRPRVFQPDRGRGSD